AIATVALSGLLLSSCMTSGDRAGAGDQRASAASPWTGPVPKAKCGQRDRSESGLQGQTTADERSSGDSERGYNCNLELVGQFQGEGVYSQNGPAYFGDCAYISTENNSAQRQPGVMALGVS